MLIVALVLVTAIAGYLVWRAGLAPLSPDQYLKVVHQVLRQRGVVSLLNSTHAVVLERVARGGGATRWYSCDNQHQLAEIATRLRPGSSISFYFDGRIQGVTCSSEHLSELERIIDEHGEVVFGVLAQDRVSLKVDFLTDAMEVAEATSALDPTMTVFYGLFPGRDNDGVNAVTFDLPDADGVTRAHPH